MNQQSRHSLCTQLFHFHFFVQNIRTLFNEILTISFISHTLICRSSITIQWIFQIILDVVSSTGRPRCASSWVDVGPRLNSLIQKQTVFNAGAKSPWTSSNLALSSCPLFEIKIFDYCMVLLLLQSLLWHHKIEHSAYVLNDLRIAVLNWTKSLLLNSVRKWSSNIIWKNNVLMGKKYYWDTKKINWDE